MSEATAFILGLAVLIGFWLYKSVRVVKAAEAGVVTTFGKPEKAVESGLIFIPFPLCDLIVFPTSKQELEFNTRILTKKDKGHSAVNVTVHLSLRFRYPTRMRPMELPLLLKTVKIINSLESEYLHSLFMEPVVDLVEDVCQEFDWERLYHDRKEFNTDIKDRLDNLLKNDRHNILVESQIRNVSILLTNLELPQELEAAISKPESASLEADAEAIKVRKVAAAKADAKRMDAQAEKERVDEVYSSILGKKHWTPAEGAAIRGIEGREEMAKGDGVYIVSDDLASGLAASIPIAHIMADAMKGPGKKK